MRFKVILSFTGAAFFSIVTALVYLYVSWTYTDLEEVLPPAPTLFVQINDPHVLLQKVQGWEGLSPELQKWQGIYAKYALFLKPFVSNKMWLGVYHHSAKKDTYGGFVAVTQTRLSRMAWEQMKKEMKQRWAAIEIRWKGQSFYKIQSKDLGIIYVARIKGVLTLLSQPSLMEDTLCCTLPTKYRPYTHPLKFGRLAKCNDVLWGYFDAERFESRTKDDGGSNYDLGFSLKLRDQASLHVVTHHLAGEKNGEEFTEKRMQARDRLVSFVPENTWLYVSKQIDRDRLKLLIQALGPPFFNVSKSDKTLRSPAGVLRYVLPWVGSRGAFWVSEPKDNEDLGLRHLGAVVSLRDHAKFWMFYEGRLKQELSPWQETFYKGYALRSAKTEQGLELSFVVVKDWLWLALSLDLLKQQIDLIEDAQRMSLYQKKSLQEHQALMLQNDLNVYVKGPDLLKKTGGWVFLFLWPLLSQQGAMVENIPLPLMMNLLKELPTSLFVSRQVSSKSRSYDVYWT